MSIPLIVHRGADIDGLRPVRAGLPLPKGEAFDSQTFAVFESGDRELAAQTRALAHWSDGSIRWLLVEFLAELSLPQEEYRVEVIEDRDDTASAIAMDRVSEDLLKIDTGSVQFDLDLRAIGPFQAARRRGVELLGNEASQTLLTTERGRNAHFRVESIEIEAGGPVHGIVQMQGSIVGLAPCCFTNRLTFYHTTGLVRQQLTIHNPSRAKHAGGLWDLGDPGSALFRDLSLQLRLAGAGHEKWLRAEPEADAVLTRGDLSVTQFSSGGERWNGRNHANRHGEVPLRIRGYQGAVCEQPIAGARANPTVTIAGLETSLAVAVPEFWQQFPKAIAVTGNEVRISLFPESSGDLFELQAGEQKTSEVWFDFAPSREGRSLEWVHEPPIALATPSWYSASGAIANLAPASNESRPEYEQLLQGAIHGPDSFAAKRESIDEFGWRHYGDLHADHEDAFFTGERPVVSHYNNQYDAVFGMLTQFWRTGNPQWLRQADPLARHIADIDVYRTACDKSAYAGGLFWHTAHYADAGTATHRCYSKINVASQGPTFGGGPANEHNYTTGLLHTYYLTGEPIYRDTVLMMARWVRDADDGRKNLLGLVDDGPTGWASFTRDWHGPGRGAGNSINALLDAWTLTRESEWLDKAEELIRRCVHPSDNPARDNLLDPESRWSYLVFLQALVRYLDLRIEQGAIDENYAYGRSALLTYARWMADHETPFLDRPEQLEYVTETWAAQELRKPIILRQAMRFTDDVSLREKLRTRADALSQAAWRQLMSFPTRTCTRPIVLLLTLGAADEALTSNDGPAAPVPTGKFHWGAKRPFVTQRERVKALVRSPGRWPLVVARLLRPSRWLELFGRTWTAQRLRNVGLRVSHSFWPFDGEGRVRAFRDFRYAAAAQGCSVGGRPSVPLASETSSQPKAPCDGIGRPQDAARHHQRHARQLAQG